SPDKVGVEGPCVVGADLAKQLGLSSGGKLTLSYGDSGSATPEESKAKGSGTTPATISTPGTKPGDKTSSGTDRPLAATEAKVRTYSISGIVTTGGPEDGQIMMPLAAAQDLSSLNGKLSAVAISALGGESSVESFARQVDSRIPSARADLVRQISENEGRVLGKLRLTMLLVTLLILIAASLSVATTLTALVMDRQKEIGTMKAIGARENTLLRQFLFELGTLGVTGGIIGYLAGIVLAQPIGRSMFQSSIAPRVAVFGIVVVISVAVAAVSGIIPLRRIKNLQPAVILRGE
ncbi:MAG: ABC transporter permease, partial [Blastocatellia bacterium]